MFISKTSISRRAVLRGVGATIALPFLDAMVPALTAQVRTAANPVRRFGTVFVGLGERPSHWRPATEGGHVENIVKPSSPAIIRCSRNRESVTGSSSRARTRSS